MSELDRVARFLETYRIPAERTESAFFFKLRHRSPQGGYVIRRHVVWTVEQAAAAIGI